MMLLTKELLKNTNDIDMFIYSVAMCATAISCFAVYVTPNL